MLVACSAPSPQPRETPSQAPTPPAALKSAPPLAPDPVPIATAVLDPVLVEPASGRTCVLRWNELKAAMPPTIDLRAADPLGDECVDGFDPRATCVPNGSDCFRATMRGGHEATLSVVGPEGSGHFETLGLSIDGQRGLCLTASTVGWRYLSAVGHKLAPLPWLTDADGDGDAELVVWSRLPWGDSEVTNALVPVVYALDGDRLVRRDDKARALRVKVADAYHELANLNESPEARACFVAVTAALGG